MTTLEFLRTMYGSVSDGFLTVWTMPDKRTAFFPISDLETAAKYAENRFNSHDVYYGVGLRKEILGDTKRGSNVDVSCITAFWADIDVKSPAHKETALPETNDDALIFLDNLPLKPSIVVSSGNGLHVYWLFENPLGIATEAHRQNIGSALSGWQMYINNSAKECGWKFDNTSDLARVLRLPGGINHKLGNNVRAEILFDSGLRYAPSDFSPFIPKQNNTQNSPSINTTSDNNSEFKAKVGTSEKVIENCSFIQYCRDNSANLPEPQWYAMLGNLALCSDGREICHEFSKAYPGYNVAETDKKIDHALAEKKPHSCEYIRNSLGFEGCSECKSNCKSPVGIAVITRADEVRILLEGEISDWASVFNDDFISELSYAKEKMPGDYAKFKMRIKGKINIPDLEKCIKLYDSKFKNRRQKADGEALELDGIDLSGAVIPPKWNVTIQGGVRHTLTSKDGESESIACPDVVVITRRLVNIDSEDECLELSFYKDNHWKQVVGSRTKVYNKASIIGFGDKGLHVTSGTSAELVHYLSDYETANTNSIERVNSTSRLGWLGDAFHSSEFFPFATSEIVAFEEDKGTSTLYKNLIELGSYEEWITMIKKLRQNPIARFITSASFASPLLCKIGVRTFIIHLWHMSTSGKSAVLKAALSAWGNPLRIMGGGFATIVGLEQLAGTLRYLPFGIDEKQSADERRMPMEMLLYILGQGYGKTRGAKGGGNAEVIDWHNIVMITGEEPVTKSNSLDGVQTRTFELYGKPVDDTDFAKDVHFISENNYGFAGPIFIREICRIIKENPDYLRQKYKEISALLKEKGLKNAHADYVSAVALGDFLVSQIVFGEKAADALNGALSCAETVYKAHENEISDNSIERAWNFVTGWLVGNAQKFSLESTPCFGRVVPNAIERFDEYFVIPQFLDDALQDAGFNVRKSISGFKEQGLIESYTEPSNGKIRTKIRRRIDGKLLWGYVFKLGRDDLIPPLAGKSPDVPI